ncbi:MAG: 2-hydroxyacid dehydrogenase [Thermoplasmata archaeon]|nr:2-hydroxyacid dehydrogenase [Staphylococcus epidermidis]
MKVRVTFPVIDNYKKIGENIIGKNIIWYPDEDEAEILLVNNDNFPRKNTIKMIQTITAGVDHIDLSTIPKETLVCSNAGAYSISVAEHTFALLLSAAKDIIKRDEEMKKGIFNSLPTRLLYGKTIGIIGYGGIGKRVAKIAKAFDMKVIAIGRNTPDSNVDEYYSLENIEKLVKASDFVLLSIPLTKFTENLINKKILEIMKKNAILINVARPEIVNKEDLFQILNERNDIMYLSDVWWNEPNVKDTNLKNTILTPHIAGGKSGEVMEIAFIQAFKNIKDFIDGKVPMNIVNREEYKKIERKNTGV